MTHLKRRAISNQVKQKHANIQNIVKEQCRIDAQLEQAGDNDRVLKEKLYALYIQEYREIKSIRHFLATKTDISNDSWPELPEVRKPLGGGEYLNLNTGEVEK